MAQPWTACGHSNKHSVGRVNFLQAFQQTRYKRWWDVTERRTREAGGEEDEAGSSDHEGHDEDVHGHKKQHLDGTHMSATTPRETSGRRRREEEVGRGLA